MSIDLPQSTSGAPRQPAVSPSISPTSSLTPDRPPSQLSDVLIGEPHRTDSPRQSFDISLERASLERASTPSRSAASSTLRSSSSDLRSTPQKSISTFDGRKPELHRTSGAPPPRGFMEDLLLILQDSTALLGGSIGQDEDIRVERYLNSWASLEARYCFSFRKDSTGTKEDTIEFFDPKTALEKIWLPFVNIELQIPQVRQPSIEKTIDGTERIAYHVETTFNLWAVSPLDPDLNPLAGRGSLSDTIVTEPEVKILKRTMIIKREILPDYTRVFDRGTGVDQALYNVEVPAFFNRFFFFLKVANKIRSFKPYIHFLVGLSAVIASAQNTGISGNLSLSLAIVGMVSAAAGLIIWAVDRLVNWMDTKVRRDELKLMGTVQNRNERKVRLIQSFFRGFRSLVWMFRRADPTAVPEDEKNGTKSAV